MRVLRMKTSGGVGIRYVTSLLLCIGNPEDEACASRAIDFMQMSHNYTRSNLTEFLIPLHIKI